MRHLGSGVQGFGAAETPGIKTQGGVGDVKCTKLQTFLHFTAPQKPTSKGFESSYLSQYLCSTQVVPTFFY